ncbi:putative cysteine-rich receptor-like protein kinase 31 [Panicum virgatum]|uniref:putative cysteine-rich receptor-like protein kinase 31 n=1 Tax=Panicum virgatum TaxID=38727 RepID=UPI0019D532DA|nr:putative cysteine-rich receptor-like protein kinase 31 [Panicum virgatum]
MALWNGLGQAATVAQLAGVDAGGLISMIIQAVQTVHRNREECRQLVHHVMMISDLLQMLQQSEMMQRSEIRRPLEGLEDTLRQAYMLVTSCQQSNAMYRFMAGNQAQKFRDIRDRIDSYLRIYPLISHIDTRYFLTGLYSRAAHPPGTQQPGCRNAEVLRNKKHPFRWLVQWAQRQPVQLVQREPSAQESTFELIDHEPKVFNFSELVASTDNFLYMLGRGGYGSVYKGVLPNGADVVIKFGNRYSGDKLHEFLNEVQIVPKLQHANIIKFLGFCSEGDNKILVYEYMPRGSLQDIIDGIFHLNYLRFMLSSHFSSVVTVAELKAGVNLAWPLCFRIIEGITQGLVYLHQHSRLHVVHADIKPSNILLDCDMTPRIADFGTAEVLSSEEDEKETSTVKGSM